MSEWVPQPTHRWMSVIAQDPSVRRGGKRTGKIIMARIRVPFEKLEPGPLGCRIQVVDYDSSTGRFYGDHVIPDVEPKAWREGAPSILDDFAFHAQNAYALVAATLMRFEFALGRRVGWSFESHQLKIAPHGMLDANAFYAPDVEGLVFGYFFPSARRSAFTGLSHDIVVHETSHALLDGLRPRYMYPSSDDQAAFHEGYADIIALLSVMAQRELVEELLRPSAKKRSDPEMIHHSKVTPRALAGTALFGLAEGIGRDMTGDTDPIRGEALRRSVRLEADPSLIEDEEYREPHRRGEILVAAVMKSFLHIWSSRILGLSTDASYYPLARVAEECADIAEVMLAFWIRAIDYMPPIHLTFPDVLSAALTADLEARPDDVRYELRKHVRTQFEAFDIRPAPRSDPQTGGWESPAAERRAKQTKKERAKIDASRGAAARRRGAGAKLDSIEDEALHYENVRAEALKSNPDEVFRFLWDNRVYLGLRQDVFCKVLSVRPCRRIGSDGQVLHETVAEYYQVARLTTDELKERGIDAPAGWQAKVSELRADRVARSRPQPAQANDHDDEEDDIDEIEAGEPTATDVIPVYGGGTLIFDEYCRLKYHIHNDVFGQEQSERLEYLWQCGFLQADSRSTRIARSRIGHIHRMRAMDSRRMPRQEW
ncbi:MAG: hypothetical protein AB7I09_20190 [Planctomycetota bacterium]